MKNLFKTVSERTSLIFQEKDIQQFNDQVKNLKELKEEEGNANTQNEIADNIGKLVYDNPELLPEIKKLFKDPTFSEEDRTRLKNILNLSDDLELLGRKEFKKITLEKLSDMSFELDREIKYPRTGDALQQFIYGKVESALSGSAVFTSSNADKNPQVLNLNKLLTEAVQNGRYETTSMLDPTEQLQDRVLSAVQEYMDDKYMDVSIYIGETKNGQREMIIYNKGTAKNLDQQEQFKISEGAHISHWGKLYAGFNLNSNKYGPVNLNIDPRNMPKDYALNYRESGSGPMIEYVFRSMGLRGKKQDHVAFSHTVDYADDLHNILEKLGNKDQYFSGADEAEYFLIAGTDHNEYRQKNWDRDRYTKLNAVSDRIGSFDPTNVSLESIDAFAEQVLAEVYGMEKPEKPDRDYLFLKGGIKNALINNRGDREIQDNRQEFKKDATSDVLGAGKLEGYYTRSQRNAMGLFIQDNLFEMSDLKKNAELYAGCEVHWDDAASTFVLEVGLNPGLDNKPGLPTISSSNILAVKAGIKTFLGENKWLGDIKFEGFFMLIGKLNDKASIQTGAYNAEGIESGETARVLFGFDESMKEDVMPVAGIRFSSDKELLLNDKGTWTLNLGNDMYLPPKMLDLIAGELGGQTVKDVNEASYQKAGIERDWVDWVPPILTDINIQYQGENIGFIAGGKFNVTEAGIMLAYNEENIFSALKEIYAKLNYKWNDNLATYARFTASPGAKGDFQTFKQTWEAALGVSYEIVKGINLKGEVYKQNMGQFNTTGAKLGASFDLNLHRGSAENYEMETAPVPRAELSPNIEDLGKLPNPPENVNEVPFTKKINFWIDLSLSTGELTPKIKDIGNAVTEFGENEQGQVQVETNTFVMNNADNQNDVSTISLEDLNKVRDPDGFKNILQGIVDIDKIAGGNPIKNITETDFNNKKTGTVFAKWNFESFQNHAQSITSGHMVLLTDCGISEDPRKAYSQEQLTTALEALANGKTSTEFPTLTTMNQAANIMQKWGLDLTIKFSWDKNRLMNKTKAMPSPLDFANMSDQELMDKFLEGKDKLKNITIAHLKLYREQAKKLYEFTNNTNNRNVSMIDISNQVESGNPNEIAKALGGAEIEKYKTFNEAVISYNQSVTQQTTNYTNNIFPLKTKAENLQKNILPNGTLYVEYVRSADGMNLLADQLAELSGKDGKIKGKKKQERYKALQEDYGKANIRFTAAKSAFETAKTAYTLANHELIASTNTWKTGQIAFNGLKENKIIAKLNTNEPVESIVNEYYDQIANTVDQEQ